MRPTPRLRIALVCPLVLCFICLNFLTGCAATIKYSFDKAPARLKPFPYHAIVSIEDARSVYEREGVFEDSAGEKVYTKDKDFKPDVPVQIASTLAGHLRAAKLFESVTVQTFPADVISNEEAIQGLASQGVDLAIIGRLKHFYGYQTEPNRAFSMAGAFGGAIGGAAAAIAEMLVNPKTVGGKVTYGPVRGVDVRRKQVLWEEEVEASFERKEKFYKGQVAYALQALKEANQELVKRLNERL